MNDGIFIVRTVGAIDAGKHGLQVVVVLLRNRIELVIVAARAMRGHAAERGDRGRDHVVAIQQPSVVLVGRPFAQFLVADEIPGPGGQETRRDEGARIVREQHVARDLLLNESRIRLVLIERANHVVAIRPRVRPRLVLVVSVRIAVVDDVQPVPRPPLPVAWGSEQTVDQFFVRVRLICRPRRPPPLRAKAGARADRSTRAGSAYVCRPLSMA